ncbi:hypothetical protein GCM10022403_072490 [Streptomyces coacervatus]|uniref:Uncharacterized protein n=1 Tax=Streptomyces coacervatus TaxID=647381 RepID=A0ABP7IWG5_9ACTN
MSAPAATESGISTYAGPSVSAAEGRRVSGVSGWLMGSSRGLSVCLNKQRVQRHALPDMADRLATDRGSFALAGNWQGATFSREFFTEPIAVVMQIDADSL